MLVLMTPRLGDVIGLIQTVADRPKRDSRLKTNRLVWRQPQIVTGAGAQNGVCEPKLVLGRLRAVRNRRAGGRLRRTVRFAPCMRRDRLEDRLDTECRRPARF